MTNNEIESIFTNSNVWEPKPMEVVIKDFEKIAKALYNKSTNKQEKQ